MKISIIGTGYVGLVTGTCFAHMGNNVLCVDVDHEKIDLLRKGSMPIYEPGLKELVASNVKEGRLSFITSTDEAVRASEFIFIAVGTPMGEDGSADVQHVLDVARRIGEALVEHHPTRKTQPLFSVAWL